MDVNYNATSRLNKSDLTFNFGTYPPKVRIGFLLCGYHIIVKSVFSSLIRVILQMITSAACFYHRKVICTTPASCIFQYAAMCNVQPADQLLKDKYL